MDENRRGLVILDYDDKSDKKSDDKQLDCIREDIRDWYQYFAENIARHKEMKSFNAGSQWTYQISQEYQNQQKEPLVLNLSARFIKRVVGEMLTNSPQVKVTASTVDQDPKVIETKNDVIRTICHKEKFDQAKQAAFTDALSGGWGVLSIYTQYADGLTFDQEVKIETVNDATLGFFDPSATQPTKADGNYAGLINYIPEKEFKRRWPGKEISMKSFIPEDAQSYVDQGSGQRMVQVADYYKKKYKKVTIVKVSPTLDGSDSADIKKADFSLYVKKFNEQEKQKMLIAQLTGQQYQPQEKPQIYQERKASIVSITCIRCTYDQVLEEYEWPSTYLPVIFVAGSYAYLEGLQRTTSYTEDIVDIQRFINYLWSEMVIYIRRARKEGFIGTPEMAEGREEIWRNPERVQGLLLANFDARVPGGLPIPLTNVLTIPPVLIELYQTAVQTMMQIIGQSEASLGLQGNERSGLAIERRRMQESYNTTSNYQYLLYATEQAGMIINDLVDKLYDSERPMMLKRKDGTDYATILNKQNNDTDDMENSIADTKAIVSIDASSNYEFQRLEERDFMMGIAQLNPQVALSQFGDLLGKTLKSEITNELVDRLQMGLAPDIKAKVTGQPMPSQQPNPMIQLEQQKIQMMQQQNALKGQQIQTEVQKNQNTFFTNLMDFKASQSRNDTELQKQAMETAKSFKDADTHKVKHAAAIVGNFKDLMAMHQAGQQQTTAPVQQIQQQQ